MRCDTGMPLWAMMLRTSPDGRFRLLHGQHPSMGAPPNRGFVARSRNLVQRPAAILGCLLPAEPATLRDDPEVSVPLGGATRIAQGRMDTVEH
jgi:hypothetical protein